MEIAYDTVLDNSFGGCAWQGPNPLSRQTEEKHVQSHQHRIRHTYATSQELEWVVFGVQSNDLFSLGCKQNKTKGLL